ncbi:MULTISPECIES: ParB/RepB/Spo0J family partition protein [Halobacteriovorax]|uniref:ParB/RepB/Spo0J family partition protein n=1 Tax=Halobacteriovorax vibrionivorans TaxID=2152716 RepID=A0ABY0III4_9BACT|nr:MULTISPECIES: ParB/RepB/Spo0J family partition protein [Halobacteriovorax]RZF22766.1 ParB/RepB/Spo0J family partition protein [Halobacteriovorax vibrionivorans]TGD46202.1 ParB/RepB/Spo0J family partition protein [Halobacteriovorax sp. Y22]
MAKKFAPRVSKKERKTLKLTDNLDSSVMERLSGDRLLQGAKLDEVYLKEIVVKEQVRTKFNDSSLKELAENIKQNGLIQPLVLHKDKLGRLTLVCGERRYRAMSLIEKEKCPCFILDKKNEQELMAIQFSENSSREALHYIDKADGILNYQKATKASERKIQAALGISKSEVHRSLMIAKMGKKIKEAAKAHNIEKYVLLELDALEKSPLKTKLTKMLYKGELTKRAELKKAIKDGGVIKPGRKKKKPTVPKGLTANAFIKTLKSQAKGKKLDKKTQSLLNELLKETQNIVDM